MRIVVCLLALAAVGAFLAHRNKEETPAVVAEQKLAQVQSSPAPHENNPHNWMKNSLDRAADVKRQIQQQRKENSTN